jgi:hypothetical protein
MILYKNGYLYSGTIVNGQRSGMGLSIGIESRDSIETEFIEDHIKNIVVENDKISLRGPYDYVSEKDY